MKYISKSIQTFQIIFEVAFEKKIIMFLAESEILLYIIFKWSTYGGGLGRKCGNIRRKKKTQQFPHAVNPYTSSFSCCIARCQSFGEKSILNNHTNLKQTKCCRTVVIWTIFLPLPLSEFAKRKKFGTMSDKN